MAIRWRRRLLLGVVGLAVVDLLAFASLTGGFRNGGWVDHWQALIAGVLAIVAALIGGAFVYGQTRLTGRQDADRLRRRHAAARATMPLTLSALMEYARGCGGALRALYLSTRSNSVGRAQLEEMTIPPIPTASIPALAEMIEASPDEVAAGIAALLRQLQVQDGRLRSLKSDVLDPLNPRRNITKLELEDYILDAADIYARCEGMLDYAREEADAVSGEPGAADQKRALWLMSYFEPSFDRVKATIDRRHGGVLGAEPVSADA